MRKRAIQATVAILLYSGALFAGGRLSVPPWLVFEPDGTLTVGGIHLENGENLDIDPAEKTVRVIRKPPAQSIAKAGKEFCI